MPWFELMLGPCSSGGLIGGLAGGLGDDGEVLVESVGGVVSGSD